jgi:hypothetical protein
MSNTEFDLDDAVTAGESVEADVEGFAVEEVAEGNTDSTEEKRSRRNEEDVDPSEFQFDATPRPRVASGEKKTPGEKRSYVDLPEGWVTPTQLRNHLFDERIADLKPQAMYGFVKSGKNFPYKKHTDGRYIVPVEDETAQAATEHDGEGNVVSSELANGPSDIGAKSWVIQVLQKRADREAKALADADKAAETEGELVS